MVVSGSGQRRHLRHREGPRSSAARVVACSDSDGYVVDEKGIDLELLKEIKEVERRSHPRLRRSAWRARTSWQAATIWDVPCDVALPCATQNELNGNDAAHAGHERLRRRRRRRQHAHARPTAVALFSEAGVAFGPGKAANAGGVATRALEMQQNASPRLLDASSTPRNGSPTSCAASTIRCLETAEEYGAPGNYVVGANIAGFIRVADAMVALGVI